MADEKKEVVVDWHPDVNQWISRIVKKKPESNDTLKGTLKKKAAIGGANPQNKAALDEAM